LKFLFLLVLGLSGLLLHAQELNPVGGGVREGTLPRSFIPDGPKCMEAPEWQVHEYNPDLYIIRESGCVNYEKPLMYLLFGKEKAILFDSGSGETTIDTLMARMVKNWLTRNGKTSIELIVAHTHAHEDHIAGDAQLKALKNPAIKTTVIPLDVKASQSFFHIAHWPDDLGSVDLGGRIIDVIPIPGHDFLSIAYYDRQTGVLITGDTLCPGRLYVDVADFREFKRSVQRMITFTDGKIVAHVLGAHIEETRTPYLEYPFGTIYQPDEHDLSLSRAHLLELKQALDEMGDKPVTRAMKDYTISPADAAGWKVIVSKLEATRKAQEARMWDQQAPPSAAH
jgi:hydroxyacylglutathione hydrolase